MSTPAERLLILERLEKGEITSAEAARQLSGDAPRPSSPMEILEQVDRGEMNADEAARRLESMKASAPARSGATTRSTERPKIEVVDGERFNPARTWGWWLLPIGLGALFTLFSGLWMRNTLADGGIGLAFFCAWVPLAIGLLLIVIGWAVRQGHWLHVHVTSKKPNRNINVNLDVPLPTQLATGLMNGFGVHIPGLDESSVNKIVDALRESKRNGNPLHIHTSGDDGDDDVNIVIS